MCLTLIRVFPPCAGQYDGPKPGVARMPEVHVERRHERNAFLFLTVLLAPILAVGTVAGWGFVVWAFQLIAGPPGAAP